MATPRSHAPEDHAKRDVSSSKKSCRSCMDFKAWRAQMQGKTHATTGNVNIEVWDS